MMAGLRRFLLPSDSFPNYIQEHKPKVTGAHRHSSMYIHICVPECERKSLAGWKFSMETHLWINRGKSRLELWISKLRNTWLCDVCLPGIFSPSCLENVSRLNAAFKSLCSYIQHWGFHQAQTEANGKYLYIIKAYERHCVLQHGTKESFKSVPRRC